MMMPDVLRIVQAPSNQTRRSANTSSGRYVAESKGKNFLLSLMEQSERDGGSAPRSQETSSPTGNLKLLIKKPIILRNPRSTML